MPEKEINATIPYCDFTRLITDLMLHDGSGKYENTFKVSYDLKTNVLTIHNFDLKTRIKIDPEWRFN